MAKRKPKEAPNKSRLIREYVAENPSVGPSEVARAVGEKHGFTVTPQFVSTILSNDKRKGKDSKSGMESISADLLIAAKKFVQSVGGIDSAKQTIGLLETLLA